jgi:hypothetical protein
MKGNMENKTKKRKEKKEKKLRDLKPAKDAKGGFPTPWSPGGHGSSGGNLPAVQGPGGSN